MNCLFCNAPFTPKRATAQYCSGKCRAADARKKAREQAAEEGDPSVVWVSNEPPEQVEMSPVQEPQKEIEQENKGPKVVLIDETPLVEGNTEFRIKYAAAYTPLEVPPGAKIRNAVVPMPEIPLKADTNSLARQVIAGMKQRRPLTELELLEKNQLK